MSINPRSCHSEPVTDVTGVGIRNLLAGNLRKSAGIIMTGFFDSLKKHHPVGWCFFIFRALRSKIDEARTRFPASHEWLSPFAGALPLPLDLTRCAPVEAASSTLPAAFQKEKPPKGWFFFIFRALRSKIDEARTRFPASHEWLSPFAGALPLPLDLTRCAPVEAASSTLPAAFQKEKPPKGWFFFLEQGTGVEPALTAWEAAVIPIYQPCIHFTGLL